MDLAALLKSHFLCHLIFCYVFIASGLIINTVQLFTLLLWPVNKQLFRKINCRLSYCISSQLVMLLEWWSGTECVIYTDPGAYPKYGKENAIVVLNHKFEIDFLCGWSLAESSFSPTRVTSCLPLGLGLFVDSYHGEHSEE
uniref:1-acylglycerol-3-phosphate O-acyltransferase n=1 Tax=Moschus moschiferus TaxID=68415 RepID=A0A8C6CT44_MOSMO